MDSAVPTNSTNKYDDRMKRLRDLHLKRNEARKLNHQEVVEEDRKAKLPPNWEKRQKRAEWELEHMQKKKEAEEKGEDFDRLQMLEMSVDEADRLERARAKKRNPDPGFSNFEDATARSYANNTKQIKLDADTYLTQREKLGEGFYPTAHSLTIGQHKDSKESIDKMVADLDKQIEKRTKYHRRRPYDPDAPIDFINERNKKFNKKIERFYGAYTEDIKKSIQRGTAV